MCESQKKLVALKEILMHLVDEAAAQITVVLRLKGEYKSVRPLNSSSPLEGVQTVLNAIY